MDERHRQPARHNTLADLHHDRGTVAAAMAQIEQAVSIFAEIGSGASPGETATGCCASGRMAVIDAPPRRNRQ